MLGAARAARQAETAAGRAGGRAAEAVGAPKPSERRGAGAPAARNLSSGGAGGRGGES
jgi:hypothetical protein